MDSCCSITHKKWVLFPGLTPTRFKICTIMLTVSPHKYKVTFSLFSIFHAISCITLFFLSTIPLCQRVIYRSRKFLMYTLFITKTIKLVFFKFFIIIIVNSRDIKIFSICNLLNNFLSRSKDLDFSLNRIAQVYLE